MTALMHAEQAPIISTQSSLSRLFTMLDNCRYLDPAIAAALLEETSIDPLDLCDWHDFEHPIRDSYGRKLVKRGPNFELMVMSWMPGDHSAIHDHGIAEWGAVQYFGPADHVMFKEQNGVLNIDKRMTMRLRSVCEVDRSLIHLMGNPSDLPFISLHLYGRTDPAEFITGNARVFDLLEQRIQRTDGGVFFCLPEAEIRWREGSPAADIETTLLHHNLMLDRIERILCWQRDNSELQARAHQLRAAIAHLSAGTEFRHEQRIHCRLFDDHCVMKSDPKSYQRC